MVLERWGGRSWSRLKVKALFSRAREEDIHPLSQVAEASRFQASGCFLPKTGGLAVILGTPFSSSGEGEGGS